MSVLGQLALGVGIMSAVLWVVINVGAWWAERPGLDLPWNWRVLVWPDVYYRWLDARQDGP